MYTKDSRGREIWPGAPVVWNNPPHLGGEEVRGTVLWAVKGGWFRVLEDQPGAARGVQGDSWTVLVKPSALTIVLKRCRFCFGLNTMRHNDHCRTILYGEEPVYEDVN